MATSTGPDISLPVLLLTGEEVLLLKRAEEDVINRALPSGRSAFNYSSHSAEDGGPAALTAARTIPMMSRRRVVVLRDIDKARTDLIEQIMAYVASPSESTLLVLIGPKLPPASGGKNLGVRLRNLVKKHGGVHKYTKKDVRPQVFVQEHARQHRCTINNQAARLLVELVGNDLGRLQGELDKLINYIGGPGHPISTEAVEAVCSVVAEAVIWALTDALLRKDVDGALAAMHRLLEDGEASHRLLSTVTWQFRELLVLQEAMHTGGGLPGRWGRMSSRKVHEAKRLLQQHPLVAADILGALSNANHAFNRSRAGDRRILEGLILQLAVR